MTSKEQSQIILRRLSKQIAEDLFRDGSGRIAKRLVHDHSGNSLEGGGWGYEPVIDRIERILTNFHFPAGI